MKLEVPIKVDIDDVTELIHDLQCLQTYKLGVNETTVLVSLDAIVDVFKDHIRAKRLDKDIDVPAKKIIRCKDCYWWTKREASLQGRCALLGIYPTGACYCVNARKRGESDG